MSPLCRRHREEVEAGFGGGRRPGRSSGPLNVGEPNGQHVSHVKMKMNPYEKNHHLIAFATAVYFHFNLFVVLEATWSCARLAALREAAVPLVGVGVPAGSF